MQEMTPFHPRMRLALTGLRLPVAWNEPVLVGVFALATAGAAVALGGAAAGSRDLVYLTPDGSHAVTDAWGLLGLAPRTFYYLPAWPLVLLPFLLLGAGVVGAVHAGLTVVLAALFVSLYALARQFTTPRAAFVGAVAGTFSTPIGEIMGWQGFATTVGLVGTVVALVFLEQWLRHGRRRDAALTGVAYAYVIASHPFMVAVASGLIGLRWLAALYRARRISVHGTSALSLTGILPAVAAPALAVLLLYNRYAAIEAPSGSAPRWPVFAATLAQFDWITRESMALAALVLLLTVAALLAPLAIRSVAFGVTFVFVLLPACLSGDPSYQSRVVYLVPIVLTLGGAWLWLGIEERVRIRLPHQAIARAVQAAAPPIAAVMVVSLGFAIRLPAAASYYPELRPADLRLLSSLAAGHGTIVTSWTGNRYWDGMEKSWYAEALTNRASIGPADPAMSTRSVELIDSAAAWQFFSGQQGVQNGALQVSFGPQSWRADPAVAVAGYYIPLVYINDGVNEYGSFSASTAPMVWTVGANGVATGRRMAGMTPVATASAVLRGNRVELQWTRGAAAAGSWTIWIWPQYGLPWSHVQATAQTAVITPDGGAALHSPGPWIAADPEVTISVSGMASLRYVASDPRYHLQAIAITVPAGTGLAATISVSGADRPGSLQRYDERSIITSEHITNVVVWRDTGWVSRFASSACFAVGSSDAQIQIFDVAPACQQTPIVVPSAAPRGTPDAAGVAGAATAAPSVSPHSSAASSLPAITPLPTQALQSVAPSTALTYRVKAGDTLVAIAARFRVSVARLEQLNGITDPRTLRTGQVLRIR